MGRAVEALLLALAGAIVARVFVGLLLVLGPDTPAWTTAVGLAFLIWPGVVNLAAAPFGAQPIGPDALAGIALATGGLTGLANGLWAVHRWPGRGLLEFLLDVTWALPGSSAALLAHAFALRGGAHAGEARHGAHRYRRGLTPGRDFAFTLGAVMSNTGDHGPGSDLFRHEMIHVWQARLAGPLFWTSYLAWMALAAPAAALVALARRRPLGPFVQWWAYDQNPWEVMAYRRANPGVREARRRALG
jgi:hypothetical protein